MESRSPRMGRRDRRTASPSDPVGAAVMTAIATTLGVVLAGCGTADQPQAAAAGTEPVASASSPTTVAASSPAAGPPAEVPDPCSLLTPEQAATVGGVSPLTAGPTGGDGYPKACAWSGGSEGAPVVILQVGLLYAPSPDDLPSWQQQFLDNETGQPVAGVGDGAEIYSGSPATVVGVDGYVRYRLQAYNGDPSVTTLLPQAAGQVVAALAAG